MSDGVIPPQQIIVLIDRQASWLERAAEALRQADFEVYSQNEYIYPNPHVQPQPKRSVLVILGCASIGSDELALIDEVLKYKDHLIVASTSLPWRMMRHIFLVGADDVTDKPYNPNSLVEIVNHVLKSISSEP